MVEQRSAEIDLHLLRVQVASLSTLSGAPVTASGSGWAHESICTTSEALVG